jgi:hypothetical protein
VELTVSSYIFSSWDQNLRGQITMRRYGASAMHRPVAAGELGECVARATGASHMWRWRIVEKLTSSDQRGFGGRVRRWSHSRSGRTLALRRVCDMDHSRADDVTVGTSKSSHPRAGSNLSLSPLLSGTRGGNHGVNDAGTPRMTKNHIPDAPNVKVILQHFHRYCYKSSSLWFIVQKGLGLLSSSQGRSMVDTKIYVVRASIA